MLLNQYVSFFWGLFRGEECFSLSSLLHCHLLEVKDSQSWYFRDNEQAVIRHLRNNVISEG